MRTEVQVQGQVIGTLYLLAALITVVLAIQNYRYGLYPLVYSASFISLIFLGIAVYARLAYQVINLERANLIALSIAGIVILFEGRAHADQVMYWLIPLGLFNFIALPLNQARMLSLATLTSFSIILLLSAPILTAFLFITCYLLMVSFASTFAALHQKRSRTLVELAIHEPVTGAYNMRHLEDTLNKEICRSGRTSNPLSIVAIEIDYFDQIQEVHGFMTKQQLLEQVADTLNGMIRAGDSQYFDAHSCFYLLLPCTPFEGVTVIAERIRRTIEESSWPQVESITASLGCSTYAPSQGEKTAEDILKSAQEALEDAHRNGNNRVVHQAQ